jgi:hypothetical protein
MLKAEREAAAGIMSIIGRILASAWVNCSRERRNNANIVEVLPLL